MADVYEKASQLAIAIEHASVQNQCFLAEIEHLFSEHPSIEPSALASEVNLALGEIGCIEPWRSEEDAMYVFEHEAYPACMYVDEDKQKTIEGYLRALTCWIGYRMENSVSESMERATSGRGGKRPNAGRPKLKMPNRRIYLPKDIAAFLSDEVNLQKVRNLMAG